MSISLNNIIDEFEGIVKRADTNIKQLDDKIQTLKFSASNSTNTTTVDKLTKIVNIMLELRSLHTALADEADKGLIYHRNLARKGTNNAT